VYRIEQVLNLPVRVGRIVEWLGEETAAPALMAAVLDDARTEGAALVDFFCASARHSGTLERCGFLSDARPEVTRYPVVFQPVDRRRTATRFMVHLKDRTAASTPFEWYVTSGDGDQDRPN
jgi:hypothetical protein